MDGWMDEERMDGWMDGWMDGCSVLVVGGLGGFNPPSSFSNPLSSVTEKMLGGSGLDPPGCCSVIKYKRIYSPIPLILRKLVTYLLLWFVTESGEPVYRIKVKANFCNTFISFLF